MMLHAQWLYVQAALEGTLHGAEGRAIKLLFLIALVALSLFSILDASCLYHQIRAQSSLKLYVLYNALEVLTDCRAA